MSDTATAATGSLQTGSARSLSMSSAAARRVAELAASEGNAHLMLRIAVSGGGCSGFQYVFSFYDTLREDDLTFARAGVRLVVYVVSLVLLNVSDIDFVY